MKTKEELNTLKEEYETLNAKLRELTEEELAEITGGITLHNLPVKKEQDKYAVQACGRSEDNASIGVSWQFFD